MVRLQLSIKAELESVTDLVPSEAEGPFEYHFQVKCSSCNEVHPNLVTVNMHEEHELNGSRGSAHFVWSCKFCKRESSAKFEPGAKPRPYTADDAPHFAPLITLDCRGLEFTGFSPQGAWECKGAESGTKFGEIELGEGEWTDYDEKAKTSVSIMEIESKWARAQ
ncbi:DUF866-domain-containing protein [Calocera viscosa TUFC12733]|uniref:DUF866-domain-containing protein n=1 Tax=Calocera viscosa (strain TUFC12733) TaxID=1330018 RepID=A0A167RFI2_CALVF|nr:DUF866-domain-containing protein [Calocera viscosa TUFC12733]